MKIWSFTYSLTAQLTYQYSNMFDQTLQASKMVKVVKIAGCQLKTFKTFIFIMKPLFFSEKPLKTFILHDKPLFSGKAIFQYFCCIGFSPLKCTLGRNSGIFGILWCF